MPDQRESDLWVDYNFEEGFGDARFPQTRESYLRTLINSDPPPVLDFSSVENLVKAEARERKHKGEQPYTDPGFVDVKKALLAIERNKKLEYGKRLPLINYLEEARDRFPNESKGRRVLNRLIIVTANTGRTEALSNHP